MTACPSKDDTEEIRLVKATEDDDSDCRGRCFGCRIPEDSQPLIRHHTNSLHKTHRLASLRRDETVFTARKNGERDLRGRGTVFNTDLK